MRSLATLLDFDGTLVVPDLGELLLDAFASPEWRREADLWHSGAITFKELNEREFAYLPAGKRREMVRFALDNVKLRQGAHELVRFCQTRGIPIEIVSGGLDFYIRPVLEKFGMDNIPVFCLKHAEFSQGERIVPTYPEWVAVCEITGACKCARAWHFQAEGYQLVFVGDGNSDRCVARQADVVYACRSLARYCQEQDIAYTPFDSLTEVVAGLRSLLAGRALDS